MDAAETAKRLGSTHYFGGVRDTGTGHIHPLKLVIGTARVAAEAGAQLFENSRVTGVKTNGGKVIVSTAHGAVTAQKCLLAIDAYSGDLEKSTATHIMPIGSFIGATVPLGADSPVLPGGESVSDSRFVVRYFPPCADRRAAVRRARDLRSERPQGHPHPHPPADHRLYPTLKDIEITHGWGGYVGITVPRKPYVREVMPNVISAGGYSGHGVMLSNFVGKLYAETVAGNRDRLKLFEDLKIRPSPAEGVSRRRCCSWRSTVRVEGPDLRRLREEVANPRWAKFARPCWRAGAPERPFSRRRRAELARRANADIGVLRLDDGAVLGDPGDVVVRLDYDVPVLKLLGAQAFQIGVVIDGRAHRVLGQNLRRSGIGSPAGNLMLGDRAAGCPQAVADKADAIEVTDIRATLAPHQRAADIAPGPGPKARRGV